MRLHTDNLTYRDLIEALPSGVHAHIIAKGSRKRDHAFEVTLYVLDKDALHRRFGNSGGYGASDEVAATWDEWGVWMAALYELDPNAIVGWYESYGHFLSVTRRERERHEAQYKPTSIAYRTHRAPWLDALDIPHAEDCKPEHMSEPDDEGTRDCLNCGLWVTA